MYLRYLGSVGNTHSILYTCTKEGAETTLRHFKFVVDSPEVNGKKIRKPDGPESSLSSYLAKHGLNCKKSPTFGQGFPYKPPLNAVQYLAAKCRETNRFKD